MQVKNMFSVFGESIGLVPETVRFLEISACFVAFLDRNWCGYGKSTIASFRRFTFHRFLTIGPGQLSLQNI
jgi:hypothetical protein